MAKYNPFFEKAGMQKIQETTPPKQAQAILETLTKLGFNTTLLNGQNYVQSQLRHLTDSQLETIKQAFIRNTHPRYQKEFFSDKPYGKTNQYKHRLETADTEKLTKLINVTATLLQTKVYLFWQKPERKSLDTDHTIT
jgi:hypothetical protein